MLHRYITLSFTPPQLKTCLSNKEALNEATLLKHVFSKNIKDATPAQCFRNTIVGPNIVHKGISFDLRAYFARKQLNFSKLKQEPSASNLYSVHDVRRQLTEYHI